MMFSLPKHLIIIDVETTGTNIEKSSIIQLGAVIFNKKGYMEDKEFSQHILPYNPEWSAEAEAVHKISFGTLQKIGEPLEKVIVDFETWLYDFCKCYDVWLAQWGANFDVPLLKKAYEKINRPFPFHYRTFDVASIVRYEMAKNGALRMSCGEGICAGYFGIEVEQYKEHDALYDAKLSGLMLEAIVKKGKK